MNKTYIRVKQLRDYGVEAQGDMTLIFADDNFRPRMGRTVPTISQIYPPEAFAIILWRLGLGPKP